MPGTFIVSPETFASAIVMATTPKLKYQTEDQEVNAAGERKWYAQVAVSYQPDANLIISPAEVLSVSIAGEDPGITCPPGTQVTFDQLRAGVSGVEQRERKDGNGTRVVGGKLFYSAKALKPAQSWSGSGRKSEAA